LFEEEIDDLFSVPKKTEPKKTLDTKKTVEPKKDLDDLFGESTKNAVETKVEPIK